MRVKNCETKTFEVFVKRLQDVIHIMTLNELKEKEEKLNLKKTACAKNVKNVNEEWKKKFLGGVKQICNEDYSRNWSSSGITCSSSAEFPKLFGRKRKTADKSNLWKECKAKERRRSSYTRKRSKVRRCKPKTQCIMPPDEGACVFCLGSIYTGGYIHELYETTPLITKQSELYGDDIAWRIGNRPRVMVHKKCYKAYIDVLSREADNQDLSVHESLEEDSDDNCGSIKGAESPEEDVEKLDRNYGVDFRGSNRVSWLPWDHFSKPAFCLKKFQLPKVPSGSRADVVPKAQPSAPLRKNQSVIDTFGKENSEILQNIRLLHPKGLCHYSASLYSVCSVFESDALEKHVSAPLVFERACSLHSPWSMNLFDNEAIKLYLMEFEL